MAFESYQIYLSNTTLLASSPIQYFKDEMQNLANRSFDQAGDAYIVKHRVRINNALDAATPTWIDVPARLARPYEVKQTNLIKDDLFNLIFKNLDYDVVLGDIFEFNNFRWMVINTSNMRSVTNSVLVQRCNAELKFTETSNLTSNIIVMDALVNKIIIKNLKQQQFIVLPDNKLSVQIPNDYYGQKIKWTSGGGTRFLMGRPYQNWRTIFYDNISLNRTTYDGSVQSGILRLEVELSEINTGMDDLVHGVAWQDYF